MSGGQSGASVVAASYLPSDNPTSLIAWFRMGVGVTSSGGFASAWADQSGLGHDLLQATGTNQPAYDGSAILTFDGVDNFMKCVAFTLNQPEQVSALLNQVSWTLNDALWDGNSVLGMLLSQNDLTPRLLLYAGTVSIRDANAAVGTFHAITALYNGVSPASSLKVDANAATTGSSGANNASGFTLGVRGSVDSLFSNIAVKEIIIRNVDDATIRADDHAYLQTL